MSALSCWDLCFQPLVWGFQHQCLLVGSGDAAGVAAGKWQSCNWVLQPQLNTVFGLLVGVTLVAREVSW